MLIKVAGCQSIEWFDGAVTFIDWHAVAGLDMKVFRRRLLRWETNIVFNVMETYKCRTLRRDFSGLITICSLSLSYSWKSVLSRELNGLNSMVFL
jgi:hypothetical protein